MDIGTCTACRGNMWVWANRPNISKLCIKCVHPKKAQDLGLISNANVKD